MAKVSEKVKVYEIGIDELKPDPANANAGTVRGHKMIEDSVAQTGLHRGVAIDANGYLVAGNKTQQAAIDAGFKKAVVVETDGDTLVVTKRRDFNLMDDDPNNIARRAAFYDNRTSEIDLAWSAEQLLADLQSGVDLGSMFNQDELDALLDGLIKKAPMQSAEAQIDKAAELQKQWGISLGQIWQLGKHRLAVGDCTDKATVERLMQGERADMVFTDPPYGVEWQNNAVKRFDKLQNDDRILNIAPIIEQVMGEDTGAFIWTTQSVYPQWRKQFGRIYKSTIIWNKGGGGKGDLDGDFMPVYEMALFCVKGRPTFQGKREANVWNVNKDAMDDYQHPTQKPVELAQIAINSMCKKNGLVFDGFGGSGSTLIACEQLGRQARLIELDAGYCAVILQRYKDSTNVEPVLIDSITVDKQ
jgi:DNA modification methylase